MTHAVHSDPAVDLQRLVRDSRRDAIETFLDTLPAGETARAISLLSPDDQRRLVMLLDPGEAADLVEQLPDAQAVDLIERLAPEDAAAIVDEMPSDQQADLIGDLDRADADAIIAEMEPREARDVQLLRAYPEDVAGGLMITEYLAYPPDWTVAQVVQDLHAHAEEYRQYDVQYIYATGADRTLTGVLQLRDLLLVPPDQPIGKVMIAKPLAVRDTASLDELEDFFETHPFFGVPVVNAQNVLLGLVQKSAVEEALADRNQSQYSKSQGIIGGDELRTMPLAVRARRRLSWLSVNILLNIAAASVIAAYQETLAAAIALAVFLPIISDMSGCSGNQAVAVSIRELSLGLVRPNELGRVWMKEILVGLVNGAVLGILIAMAAWLWKANAFLGLVVGVALAGNTLIAVSIGGLVPLILKRFRMDPALASGPILTTITDMCGFFLVLRLATAVLPRLAH